MQKTDSVARIALVTPLKNEMGNIPDLMQKISTQSIPIKYWIIVENGSEDGSKEYLANLKEVPNVEFFIVKHFTLPNEKYELGQKYSTVVNQGFLYLAENSIFPEIDFLGILDADCFPDPGYYRQLTSFMRQNERIGLSSGWGYTLEGKYDGEAKNWVRGNCRLWKKECFIESGYIVGPSADTLSLCKAELKGWLAIPDQTLVYHCREVGKKVNYSYYGYSAYFRGITPLYAIFKTINYFFIGKSTQAYGYFKGYFTSYFSRKERIQDPAIRNYFARYFFKKLEK
jgi:glycosyltransferase involved in cell wall biosynthesis